jgi:hypothetical protein
MIRISVDELEEVIMAKTEDQKLGVKPGTDVVRDPQTLSMIERIFYFEQLAPKADNDNASRVHALQQQASGSACFDAWAMPDYLDR